MKKSVLFLLAGLLGLIAEAQQANWQQRANYKMDVEMDVVSNRF